MAWKALLSIDGGTTALHKMYLEYIAWQPLLPMLDIVEGNTKRMRPKL